MRQATEWRIKAALVGAAGGDARARGQRRTARLEAASGNHDPLPGRTSQHLYTAATQLDAAADLSLKHEQFQCGDKHSEAKQTTISHEGRKRRGDSAKPLSRRP